MRKKFSTENLDTSRPSYPLLISLTEIFRNTAENGFPGKVFDTVRQKFSIENRYVPLFGMKFLDTPNFLKHRKVSLRNDSVL